MVGQCELQVGANKGYLAFANRNRSITIIVMVVCRTHYIMKGSITLFYYMGQGFVVGGTDLITFTFTFMKITHKHPPFCDA